MSDIRQELVTSAATPWRAFGEGGLLRRDRRRASSAFHKAQVRRRELVDHARDGAPGVLARFVAGWARRRWPRRAKDFDATVAQVIKVVDSTVEPVIDRLPEPVQVIVEQAREARDDLRKRVFGPPPC